MSDKSVHIFPLDPSMPKSEWAKLRDALLSFGFMDEDLKHPNGFVPGPNYGAFCTADPYLGANNIYFEDGGDDLIIHAGQNIAGPKVPGTNRVFDDWGAFIDSGQKTRNGSTLRAANPSDCSISTGRTPLRSAKAC